MHGEGAEPESMADDGPPYAYAWSTQTPPLPAPVDAVTIATERQQLVNDLISRRDQTRVGRDARFDAIETASRSALSILDDRENAVQAAEKAAVAAAADGDHDMGHHG
jgi:hypothetical protein